VATMSTASGDAPPHWSVDFWVADADDAAARTPELAGRVLAGPFDMPGFRRVVIADPGGAAFNASQLVIADSG
jgi:uncharacterized protein